VFRRKVDDDVFRVKDILQNVIIQPSRKNAMKILATFIFSIGFCSALSAQQFASSRAEVYKPEVNEPVLQEYPMNSVRKSNFEKKQGRFGFIFSGSKQMLEEDSYFGEEFNSIGSIKLYYDRFNMFGIAHEDAGVGFDISYLNGFEAYYPGSHPTSPDIFMASKLYVSSYFFRDFDLGNIITFGIQAGPSIVANFVTADTESSPADYEGTATSLGVGLHTGQYVLKYIGGKTKKKFCLRMGFEQFFSVNSGYTGLFGAGLGF
jgi:hypothetical protein